jgi:hypothetical protein
MAKEYRDIVNPITPSDWFLYYLFTDENFVLIRERWRNEIDDIESGEPGQEGLPFLEQERITTDYVSLVVETFDTTRETAIKGLVFTEHNRTLSKDRIPTAAVENDRIKVSIGANTRFEDLEHLWRIQITTLQEKLPGYRSQRDTPSSDPLVAYLIHRERLKGRKLTEIHKDYLTGNLDRRLLAGDKWIDVNDFRKYYEKTVKGYIQRS